LTGPFFAALRFLTIIPVPENWTGGEKGLEKCLPYFPVIGLLIGIAAALLDSALTGVLPPLPAAVLTVAFLIGISGGFHMDGLADTMDGFLSSRPRERILEIMKDSCTGAMGTVAISLVILLKVSLLFSLPSGARWNAILLMPLAGRAAMIAMMVLLPYARSGNGIAAVFGKHSRLHAVWAAFVLFAAGWMLAGWTAIAAGLITIVTAAIFMRWSFLKIGGYTGDTLGAAGEITEAVLPLVFLISACNR